MLDEDTRCLRLLADRGGYAIPDQILNAIRCPTLLTGYLSDPTLPGLAAEYARVSSLIPNCSLYLSARANHPYLERPFMWTDPQSFRTVVEGFLNKIACWGESHIFEGAINIFRQKILAAQGQHSLPKITLYEIKTASKAFFQHIFQLFGLLMSFQKRISR